MFIAFKNNFDGHSTTEAGNQITDRIDIHHTNIFPGQETNPRPSMKELPTTVRLVKNDCPNYLYYFPLKLTTNTRVAIFLSRQRVHRERQIVNNENNVDFTGEHWTSL